MKFFTIALTILSAATSILAAPVTDSNELVARGGGYNKKSKCIVATTYEVTETELLYEAKCSGKSCHYHVHPLQSVP
jgi:hypothetical protein